DCSDKIQAAIDAVSSMPLVNDFRGAVVLAPGTYKCSKTLTLHTSGVVLRGLGSSRDGTTIQMTEAPHPCIVIGSKSGGQEPKGKKKSKKKKELGGDRGPSGGSIDIADDYVPSGSTSLNLQKSDAFQVGDLVRILDSLYGNGQPYFRRKTWAVAKRRKSPLAREGNQISEWKTDKLGDAADRLYRRK
ncbi:MAG: hypothetical protein EBT48_05605, partial [Verrucomicrobia bacterium]|nr:hypothetical protein [Verrucomicrobiota bacterium]